MNEFHIDGKNLMELVKPDSWVGALVYLLVCIVIAASLSRVLRATTNVAIARQSHLDKTTANFLGKFGSALVWIIALILYAHLIPPLRALGTALLTGASIASVVIGLAAQSTLGNLVAGISITLYKPFRLGDTLQVAAPTGTEIGVVDSISLGYTTLRAPDGHFVVIPNNIAASQISLNLSRRVATQTISIFIDLRGKAEIESAQTVAVGAAKQKAGAEEVVGCFLAKVDSDTATLELRLNIKNMLSVDQLRSELIAEISRRFASAQIEYVAIRTS